MRSDCSKLLQKSTEGPGRSSFSELSTIAVAIEISMDAAMLAVLFEVDGIFSFKEPNK